MKQVLNLAATRLGGYLMANLNLAEQATLKNVAAKSGLSAEILLRKARLGSVVRARHQIIREAVLQQGYLASQFASFLNRHPSNFSRALK